MAGSAYINTQRRDYSLYVMTSRSIPAATDGLKAGARRALWTARDGKKYKTATLAGATMPIHPHGECSGAINTLAAPYGNNIPLFQGDGAFGTLLKPTAYGASRYTHVKVSKFTNDVIFRDIEIIPMTDNYDGSLLEPVHFLPLIPVVLLNPNEGIAVGFATNILPRSLEDIVAAQISHLKGTKKLSPLNPTFNPLNATAFMNEETERGTIYYFAGAFEHPDATTLRITKLPYGLSHETFTKQLDKLCEKGVVIDFTDDSKRSIDILIKFKKGILRTMSVQEIGKLLGLVVRQTENLNVLDFTGKAIWSPTSIDLIRKFTDWRLEWYIKRYQRLQDLLKADLQRYYDVRLAIKHKIGAVALKISSRNELKELLTELTIVNIDYIADLPVYRFTEQEYLKNEQHIKDSEVQLKIYKTLLSSEQERRKIYLSELQEVLKKYTKGQYDEIN